MKTLINISIIFSFVVLPALAIDLPEEPPDDFFISYKVKGAEGDVPGFTFSASVSGLGTLKTSAGYEVTFDIGAKSVKNLYDTVRKSNFFQYPGFGTFNYLEIHVVADGNEKTIFPARYEESDWVFIQRAVFEVLDENRPGWRDVDK